MKSITDYFINAEPWQLCLMMVAPYLVYKFSAFGHNPLEWGILVLYFLLVVLGWIYSVGVSANRKLPADLRLPESIFTITSALPILILVYFVFAVLQPLYQGELSRSPSWLVYLHFVAIFSFAFSIWFSAKQFMTFKLNQKASFTDYYAAFMSMWFGFIGVWYIQPKITRVLARQDPPD